MLFANQKRWEYIKVFENRSQNTLISQEKCYAFKTHWLY